MPPACCVHQNTIHYNTTGRDFDSFRDEILKNVLLLPGDGRIIGTKRSAEVKTVLTKAVRLHGAGDLRLETVSLPEITEEEILAKIVTDSICMSSYKACVLGAAHKRVPDDVADHPVMIGHEFCGELLQIGRRWQGRYAPGERFTVQVALNLPDAPYRTPGYSFPYVGGSAEYVVLPACVMEQDCLLPYRGGNYFGGSLSEPMSCIAGTFHGMYHTRPLSYTHEMGIREGGRMALLASAGPMGLGAIDYALHCGRRPAVLVVTDIDEECLARAQSIYTVEEAARQGVRLAYVNTRGMEDPAALLREKAGGYFDDVIVFAPVREVVELGDRLLGQDGCLNFFSGPADTSFSASLNFFDVHYSAHHVVGTSGGNTSDMRESLDLMAEGKITPASMVTHIGGLSCVPETTRRLPEIPGGKKLIYTHADLPLTAIADFPRLGKHDPLFAALAQAVASGGGLWNDEAGRILLSHIDAHTA